MADQPRKQAPRPVRHIGTDDVVWWPQEGRWIGRASPHLTKRRGREVEDARKLDEQNRGRR